MPVPVLYGIAIGVIRLIPIAIRIGGKIVGIGYRIAAKPQYLKHAQKIFGKNNGVQHGSADKIIQQIARHNTKTQKLSCPGPENLESSWRSPGITLAYLFT